MVSLNPILTKGKALYLAYDQGLEHGPVEFNDINVDPEYILEIADKGGYNAVVLQKGLAEQYKHSIKVPLIIKLNGKTNLVKGEPISRQLCTVKEAKDLGAAAVGYTIYIGSQHESIMLKEFEDIQREAHKYGLPVIAWIYPRGKSIENRSSRELMAYAARVGLEIGADMIKIQYNGNPKDLAWAVKSAGKVKLVVAGGIKAPEKTVLKQAKEIMRSGAAGMAIGRNVWQHENPLTFTAQLRKVIFS